MSLKNALIKLAEEKPEFRQHLLPLLRQAARIRSRNQSYGFYGEVSRAEYGDAFTQAIFSAMANRLVHFGLTPKQAQEALDAVWGRHLHDIIGGAFSGKPTEFLLAIGQGRLDHHILPHIQKLGKYGLNFAVAPSPRTKRPTSTSAVRKNYYECSDGAYGLKSAIEEEPATQNDEALKAKVKDLHAALDAVHKHLDSFYLWD